MTTNPSPTKKIKKEMEEVADKVQEDLFAYGKEVETLFNKTAQGYAQQIFKVCLLDVLITSFKQKFIDKDEETYEKAKDIVLSMLSNSTLQFREGEKLR